MRSASFSRLGRPECGARSASTSGAMPLTKSCAISPVANTQRPAFMPCANLILPRPSSTGSSGSAVRNALSAFIGTLRLTVYLGVVLASRAGNVLRQAVQHPRRIGFNAAGVHLQDAIAALAQPPTALVARPCGRLRSEE